jgi:O-succinylbenzoic acid--CoA ligase
MMLVRAMVLGWHLDVVGPNSTPLKGIEKYYDFSAMVPLQLYNSLDNIDKINKLIVGGVIVSNELRLKILDLPTKIFATYGMTETITHIAIKPLNIAAGWIFEKDYFQTLEGISIRKGSRDCLVINAPRVATDEIVTNDLVEIISKNQFRWLGRVDHIINSGGIKLIPEQIEEKLSIIIKQRFFVAGVPDDILGEKLVLVIEDRESRVKSQELRSKISSLKSLNKFEIPRSIFFIDQFIETETKKIQRKKTLGLILNRGRI